MNHKGFVAAPRLRRGLALASFIIATSFLATPVAQAQSPSSSVTEQVGKAANAAGYVVDDTASGAGDVITDTGEAAGQAVTDTGSSVGDSVGGDAGAVVKDGTSGAGGAVKDTTAAVGGAVTRAGEAVEGTVKDVAGGTDGGGGTDPTGEGPGNGGEGPGKDPGRNHPAGDDRPSSNGPRDRSRSGGRSDAPVSGSAVKARTFADITTSGAAVPSGDPVDPSLTAGDLARAAAEAAERFAFPLILMALVLAFVVAQGRVDKGDGRLTHAPMTSEQDLLSFQ